jgi:hypothetical protein
LSYQKLSMSFRYNNLSPLLARLTQTLASTPPTILAFEHALIAYMIATQFNALIKKGPRRLLKQVFNTLIGILSSAVPGVSGLLAGEKEKALADIEKEM